MNYMQRRSEQRGLDRHKMRFETGSDLELPTVGKGVVGQFENDPCPNSPFCGQVSYLGLSVTLGDR